MTNNLGSDFEQHPVFDELTSYIDFYDSLSSSIMGFVSMGTTSILNPDTYVFSSISGTLESIKFVLIKGRLSDAYTLLRKYYDSTIINIYANTYLQDNFSKDNFVVELIEGWIKGTTTIPQYGTLIQYVRGHSRFTSIVNLLYQDEMYKDVRDRCNDYTHYNYFHNLLHNDNQLILKRTKSLDIFSKDLLAVFIQQFAYTFYLNDHYMMSSDYADALDFGMEPEEDSQYWVAPFIQSAFDKWIKPNRLDIAEVIKSSTSMHLQ